MLDNINTDLVGDYVVPAAGVVMGEQDLRPACCVRAVYLEPCTPGMRPEVMLVIETPTRNLVRCTLSSVRTTTREAQL